jgi:GNAT superfamily N-acetyltransferase
VSEVTVRAAEREEASAVAGMYEWLFAPPGSRPPDWDPERAAERIRRAIVFEGATILVAVYADRLAGLCTAYYDIESVRFGRRVWVEDLAVDPDQRSLGIGKKLLDAAKDWAREQGATHLELDSGEARTDAHRFYDRERPATRSICFGWEL